MQYGMKTKSKSFSRAKIVRAMYGKNSGPVSSFIDKIDKSSDKNHKYFWEERIPGKDYNSFDD